MLSGGRILVGQGEHPVFLEPSMAMRHGLIAGATGTGKTTTLKVLAEGFSDLGVPVFLTDVKGDLTSLALPGKMSAKVEERLQKAEIAEKEFDLKEYPVRFWDVFGAQGVPLRITVSDLGPSLFSRLLHLTQAQSGALQVVFKAADERGWQLDDLKDLKAMLEWAGENRKELSAQYGTLSTASLGVISRSLLELENQKGDLFFGLPALMAQDLLSTTEGRGTINILEASKLIRSPLLYSAFMLWLLAELEEILPEAGDLDRPKLVMFFDEAHLIFNDAPKVLTDQIAQTVRLIRSKGVGIFFISQAPDDLPDSVLSQLSNRIVHSLHAYTPSEQKAIRAAAAGFRANPAFDTAQALSQLATGYALVSLLDEDGVPGITQQTMILPCQSSFDALPSQALVRMAAMDPLQERYGNSIDPESAYEILQTEKEQALQQEEEPVHQTRRKSQEPSALHKAVKTAARSTARSIGRQSAKSITRSLMGSQSKTVTRQAENFAGSLISSLIGSLFK